MPPHTGNMQTKNHTMAVTNCITGVNFFERVIKGTVAINIIRQMMIKGMEFLWCQNKLFSLIQSGL